MHGGSDITIMVHVDGDSKIEFTDVYCGSAAIDLHGESGRLTIFFRDADALQALIDVAEEARFVITNQAKEDARNKS